MSEVLVYSIRIILSLKRLSLHVCFYLVGNYLRPSNNYRQLIFNINAVVLILIIC